MTKIKRTPLFVTRVVLALATSALLSASTVYTTTLSGANENPANSSTASGSIVVTLNGNSLSIFETFTGLTSGATGAHIHCCGAVGVNEPVAVPFTGFPTATFGSYTNTFDLTLAATYTSAFLTASGGTAAGAETALISALNSGMTYANIHDATFPGGEIRGQLQLVPEPAALSLLLLPLGILFASRRRAGQIRLG